MPATDSQKRERARRTREFLDQLIAHYPHCFTRERDAMHPLAIGIQKDLRRDLAGDEAFRDTPGWLIRQALALYTRSPAYLDATLAGRPRINLDGSEAGATSEEARRYARERREEQQRRHAARKKQGRRAPRPAKRPAAPELHQHKLEELAKKFNNH